MTDWAEAERACLSGDVATLRRVVGALAHSGSVRAQTLLGTALAFAVDGYAEGIRWLRTAADAGDGHAAHNLAVALRQGAPAHSPEPELASTYFEIAVRSGFEAAVSTDPDWWRRSTHPGHLIRSHPASGEMPHGFFLNVDLDLESSEDLTPLVQALEPRAYSLERAPGRASFELNVPVSPTDPEPLVREFVRLVEELQSPARDVWDRASRRTLDIGLQSARRPFQVTHRLMPSTLRAAADVGAEIAITVYALAPEDEAG